MRLGSRGRNLSDESIGRCSPGIQQFWSTIAQEEAFQKGRTVEAAEGT